MKFLIFVLLLSYAVAKNVQENLIVKLQFEEPRHNNEKLVSYSSKLAANESYAKRDQFPFVAELVLSFKSPSPQVRCTGALIKDDWIISALHCALKGEEITSWVDAYLGDVVANKTSEYRIETHAVFATFVKPSVEWPKYADFILFRLSTNFGSDEFKRITPISLPASSNVSFAKANFTAIGWSYADNNGTSVPDRVQYANFTVNLNHTDCGLVSYFLCASSSSSVTWKIDAGSPYVVYDNNGTSTLIGIHSSSIGTLAIFGVDISQFISFITNQ